MKQKGKICLSTAWVLFFLGMGAASIHAQLVHYDGSIQFSSGKYYFTEVSHSVYLNNGISFNYAKFHITADLPYIYQNSPWISYTSIGGIATGGPQHGVVAHQTGKAREGQGRKAISIVDTVSYTSSGFGDPTASFRYDVFRSYNGHTLLSANGAVKIPFADTEMGFGTGEWDFSVGSGVMTWTQKWSWSTSVAFWHFGDMPELELKDALSYGIGIGRSFDHRSILVLYSLQGMTKVISGTEAPLSTGIGVSFNISENVMVNSNFGVGLSESTPDYSVGGGWSIHLN